MKLPLLLPKTFEEVSSEDELFAKLSTNLERFIQFLSYAGDDETWVDQHPTFMRKSLAWLTELFYREQLNIELAVRLKEIIHEESSAFSPHLPFDMKVQVGFEEIPANSLLLSASSPYFYRLIRQMIAKKERVLKLSNVDLELTHSIFEMLHKGSANLWRKQQDELEKILSQAKNWELSQMEKDAETLLVRYVKPENVEEMLLQAHAKHWHTLEASAAEIYNHLERGLKIYVQAPEILVAEFLDLKSISTLAQYSKIAPIISICKFTGDLLADPDFLTPLKTSPRLLGVDFSETSAPPISITEIPKRLKSLSLSRASWASDELVEELLMHLQELTSLNLSDLTWLGLPVWMALGSLSNLVDLYLSGLKQLHDEDLQMVSLNPTALERLSLAHCKNLSSHGIQEILRAAPRLTWLDLSKTAVSDQNLAEMAIKLPRLEYLNLNGCTHYSEKGIASLKKQHPHLTIEGFS